MIVLIEDDELILWKNNLTDENKTFPAAPRHSHPVFLSSFHIGARHVRNTLFTVIANERETELLNSFCSSVSSKPNNYSYYGNN